MLQKNFQNISSKECLIVCEGILANSNRKWKAAKKLALIEEYGGAIAFHIIGIEELIKALILAADGYGFKLRTTKGMEKFFRDHEIRYALAFFIFLLYLAGEEIKKIMQLLYSEEDGEKLINELSADIDGFLRKKKTWGFRKLVKLKQELDWFSKLDLFRQDGMYCDYKGDFKSPQTIDVDTYLDTYERLNGVREVAKGLIDILIACNKSSESQRAVVDVLNKLKKDFHDNDYYSQITNLITSLSGKRPLEELKNRVTR